MSEQEKPSKPSIVDVAKIAGVSAGTVSRVINSNPKISAATVRRVIAAMDEAGYEPPHPTRRRGKSSRAQQGIHSSQVALIPCTHGRNLLASPLMSRAWMGVHKALEAEDLAMVVVPITNLNRPPAVVDAKHTDGILLESGPRMRNLETAFSMMPAVMMFTPEIESGGSWYDLVLPDNEAIGIMAARYLLKKGCRNVLVYNPLPSSVAFRHRIKAFKATMARADCRFGKVEAPSYDSEPDVSQRRGSAQQFVEHLVSLEDRPDGLFIPADLDTSLVHVELLRKSLLPSRDLWMISCNCEDVILGGLYPRPASIDPRPEMVGERAVGQLLWRMANRDKPAGGRITIPPRLVEGEV